MGGGARRASRRPTRRALAPRMASIFTRRRRQRALRPLLVVAVVLVLCQAGLGMDVNLFVAVPARHPGSHPGNYLSGSYQSVRWAVAGDNAALAAHTALGLALVLVAVAVTVRALRARARWIATWTMLGSLLVIGAGFNGASFLDFNDNTSSLIMALLAFGAIACYVLALYGAGT
jgi:hypothetical protein